MRKEKRKNSRGMNLLVVGLIILGVVLLSSFVLADTSNYPSFTGFSSGYSASSYQYQPSYQTYYGSQMSTYWPILGDKETCQGRQDVILQIAPAGCEPMVVRSDLIADQNVPVFCQVDAMQVNPLIDIKSIKNIRFSGNYPAQVLSVGFHPARAALNTRDALLGSPLINNIGYVVVVLKRTPNESTLPASVALNLTGVLEYDAGNAFGIGTNEFYLEEMDDSKWAVSRNLNSFWNGKFYVRADRFDEKEAYISIYYGDQKISSQRVIRGQDSQPIYLPGSYCNFGVIVNYNGITQATDKARIELTGNSGMQLLDVYQGSTFLNGACTVRSIDIDSQTKTTGSVTVACGSDLIKLSMAPLLNVKDLDNGKVSFLTIQEKGKDMQECKVEMTSGNSYRITKVIRSGGKLDDSWSALQIYDPSVSGDIKWQNTDATDANEANSKIRDTLAKTCDLNDDSFQGNYASDAESAFNDSISSYISIVKDFPSEKSTDATADTTYGQKALENGLQLVDEANKKGYAKSGTKSTLLSLIIQNYPSTQLQYQSALDSLFRVDSSNAGNTIRVDNQIRAIRLVSLSTPSFNENAYAKFIYGTMQTNDLKVNGTIKGVTLSHGFIMLESFDGMSARLRTNCTDAGYSLSYTDKRTIGTASNTTFSIKVGESKEVCGNTLVFKDTSIPEVARVILKPNAYGPQTETNLSVKIGIEKRAISLSPAQAEEKANTLNATIKKWESLSKGLANIEVGLKAACFVTSAVLTVKNFLSGMDGTAMARNNVMSSQGGWIDKCKDAVNGKGIGVLAGKKYDTVTQCFEANKDAIEADVNKEKGNLNTYNSNLKDMEKTVSTNGVLDEQKAIGKLSQKIKDECNSIPRVNELPLGKAIDSTNTRYPYSYSELQQVYINCIRYKSGQNIAESSLAIGNVINSSIDNAKLYDTYLTNQAAGSIDSKAITLGGGTVVRGPPIPVAVTTTTGVQSITINGVKSVVPIGSTFPDDADKAFLIDNSRLRTSDDRSTESANFERTGQVIVVGKSTSTKGFQQKAVYKFEKESSKGVTTFKLTPILRYANNNGVNAFYGDNNIQAIEEYGGGIVGNVIDPSSRIVKYFQSGPDKDMPSQVPFDVKNGWYAKVESNRISLTSNTIPNFDASGLPRKWQICNVGTDGQIDSRDQCQEVVNGVSSTAKILGLDEKTSADLVAKSRRALLDAASQKGGKVININGERMNAAPDNPLSNVQCETYMSRDECKLMFNVCDPVICPPSRCNLGGSYPVSNVQQTGIVGSALLCLPNAQEGIMLPVCLSGIRNGIDMYVTLLKQYRDCLQENVKSGRLVGICDEIQSIYMCDFFWKQAAPIANMLLPKLLEGAYGNNAAVKGGGEYLFVKGAWDNAAAGMNYFTDYYAQNTMKAFQARSVEEAGSEVCKGFISLKAPTNFKSLLEPDSPSQFYARFDETPYTSATVPATSQYKVFYTIYSGKDSGSYYSVYLKNPGDTGFTYTSQTVLVSSGYINKGGNAQETKDFTAPQGYKELCVKINAEEKCGFKQVSTDFSVNYLRDMYAKGQIDSSNIKSSSECVSGSPDAMALLANANPQAAVQEAALPSIYERGIVRVCSTTNPGGSTDPTRYVNVGYCDNPNMKCWLDSKSVSNAITAENVGMQNETLASLKDKINQNLIAQGAIANDSEANAAITAVKEQVSALSSRVSSGPKSRENNDVWLSDIKAQDLAINTATMTLYNRLILNNQKASLMSVRAEAKNQVARAYFKVISSKVNAVAPTELASPSASGAETSRTNVERYDLNVTYSEGSVAIGVTPVVIVNLETDEIAQDVAKIDLFHIEDDSVFASEATKLPAFPAYMANDDDSIGVVENGKIRFYDLLVNNVKLYLRNMLGLSETANVDEIYSQLISENIDSLNGVSVSAVEKDAAKKNAAEKDTPKKAAVEKDTPKKAAVDALVDCSNFSDINKISSNATQTRFKFFKRDDGGCVEFDGNLEGIYVLKNVLLVFFPSATGCGSYHFDGFRPIDLTPDSKNYHSKNETGRARLKCLYNKLVELSKDITSYSLKDVTRFIVGPVKEIYFGSSDTDLYVKEKAIYEVTYLRSLFGDFLSVGYVNITTGQIVLDNDFSSVYKSDLSKLKIVDGKLVPMSS